MINRGKMEAAVLLGESFGELQAILRDFTRIAQMKSGTQFAIHEERPEFLVRLSHEQSGLHLAFEYQPGPPPAETYSSALASPASSARCPDIGRRVSAALGLLTCSVELGESLANSPDETSEPSRPDPVTLQLQIETLSLMVRVACDHCPALAIHLPQTELLFTPETFEALAVEAAPDPARPMALPAALTVHPILIPEASDEAASSELDPREASDPREAGFVTIGLTPWLGYEVAVPPSPIPWKSALAAVLEFARCHADTPASESDTGMQTATDGAFDFSPPSKGDDESEELWRFSPPPSPLPANAGDLASRLLDGTPIARFEPLRHDGCLFLSESYVNRAQITCVRDSKRGEGKNPFADLSDVNQEPPIDRDEGAPMIALGAAAKPSAPGRNVSGRSLRARIFRQNEG